MSSRGVRATGTDGTDFQHRQRVAQHYQESATYKSTLKYFFLLHSLILVFMWCRKRDPPARFWCQNWLLRKIGYASCLFLGICLVLLLCADYFALLSFPRNKLQMLHKHYYGQFLTGIVPCMIGLGGQLPELIEYINDMEGSNTPTFKGTFPMVIIWYIFFAVALQIHGFSMYFSHLLASAWAPVKRD